MKHKDNSLEWHDENELVRKLDVVEAVLNLADTIDDVVDVIMGVPSCKVQITTNTSMGSDGISTRQADTPQTERSACDTCQVYNSGIPCGVEPSVCKRTVSTPDKENAKIVKGADTTCSENPNN